MAKRLNDGEATWRVLERRHKEVLARKHERVGMLTDLVKIWEERNDYDYLRELKKRLRSAENQLAAMKL